MSKPPIATARGPSQRAVREYWEAHIHDLEITQHPPGSPGFFADLEQYHFEKLHHLPRLVPFDQFRGRRCSRLAAAQAST